MKLGPHLVEYTWPGGPATARPILGELARAAKRVGFDAIAADHV